MAVSLGVMEKDGFIIEVQNVIGESSDTQFVIGLIGIDDFRKIKDKFGQNASDGTLKALAGILSDAVDKFEGMTTICHFSGERFAVCWEKDKLEPKTFFDHIKEEMDKALPEYGVTVRLGFCPIESGGKDGVSSACDKAGVSLRMTRKGGLDFSWYGDKIQAAETPKPQKTRSATTPTASNAGEETDVEPMTKEAPAPEVPKEAIKEAEDAIEKAIEDAQKPVPQAAQPVSGNSSPPDDPHKPPTQEEQAQLKAKASSTAQSQQAAIDDMLSGASSATDVLRSISRSNINMDNSAKRAVSLIREELASLNETVEGMVSNIQGIVRKYVLTIDNRLQCTFSRDNLSSALGLDDNGNPLWIQGRDPITSVYFEDAQLFPRFMQEALRGQTNKTSYRWRMIMENGSLRWVKMDACVTNRTAASVHVTAIITDVEKLVYTERDNHTFHEVLADLSACVLLYELGASPTLVYASPEAAQVFGYEYNEFFSYAYKFNVVAYLQKKLDGDAQKRFLAGEKVHLPYLRMTKRDRQPIWLNTMARIVSEPGKPSYCYMALSNVSPKILASKHSVHHNTLSFAKAADIAAAVKPSRFTKEGSLTLDLDGDGESKVYTFKATMDSDNKLETATITRKKNKQ